ncbi:MAG: hypothetical protein PHE89_01935 [Alphaproteobacteria bacterium]|nr:hypothetical protein [Alphaproteobacteria bacterium]
MKKFLLISLITLLFSFKICEAKQFVEGLEDIPLMEGLQQTVNSDIAFGNEESRFIEIYLQGTGKTTYQNVEKFYINTMPQLGWSFSGKQKGTLSFYRDGERIEIAKETETPLLIRITLKSEN